MARRQPKILQRPIAAGAGTAGRRTPDRQLARRFESAQKAHAEGRLKEAERSLRWILKRHPRQPDALHLLALVMKDAGRLEAAADHLERAIKQRPDDPVCLNNLGNVLRELGRLPEAIDRYQAALELEPDYVSAIFNLGVALGLAWKPEQAAARFRRVVALTPDDAEAWSRLGGALLDLGKDEEAMAASRRALEIDPDSADAWNDLGLAQADRGDFDQALASYRKALEREPGHAKAALNLSKIQRFETGKEPDIALVERALTETELTAGPRGDLHFALGKIHDDCGRYEEAFEHYREANRERAERIRFDPGQTAAEIDRLMEVFDAGFFAARTGFGDDSELPVFIVGMPRSGTTLVEQILAAHPEGFGAGELMEIGELARSLKARFKSGAGYPECVRELDAEHSRMLARDYLSALRAHSPRAARISDKMPGNFLHLGLVALLLPRARIIYCRRHPLDVALSIYVTDFRAGHHYSYRLDHIAAQFRQFARLMDHWRRVLPVPMLEIRYEDVVADPETQVRALLDFLDLPWNERCLKFQDVRRPVHTASAWQVRQPLYASSVGRWRRYAEQLEPLIAELAPLVEEAGYDTV